MPGQLRLWDGKIEIKYYFCALELRFGYKHRSQMNEQQLKSKVQDTSEIFQEFRVNIEKVIVHSFMSGFKVLELQQPLTLVRFKIQFGSWIHVYKFESNQCASRYNSNIICEI